MDDPIAKIYVESVHDQSNPNIIKVEDYRDAAATVQAQDPNTEDVLTELAFRDAYHLSLKNGGKVVKVFAGGGLFAEFLSGMVRYEDIAFEPYKARTPYGENFNLNGMSSLQGSYGAQAMTTKAKILALPPGSSPRMFPVRVGMVYKILDRQGDSTTVQGEDGSKVRLPNHLVQHVS